MDMTVQEQREFLQKAKELQEQEANSKLQIEALKQAGMKYLTTSLNQNSSNPLSIKTRSAQQTSNGNGGVSYQSGSNIGYWQANQGLNIPGSIAPSPYGGGMGQASSSVDFNTYYDAKGVQDPVMELLNSLFTVEEKKAYLELLGKYLLVEEMSMYSSIPSTYSVYLLENGEKVGEHPIGFLDNIFYQEMKTKFKVLLLNTKPTLKIKI